MTGYSEKSSTIRPNQRKAIEVLLMGGNVKSAASAAGVKERTMTRDELAEWQAKQPPHHLIFVPFDYVIIYARNKRK